MTARPSLMRTATRLWVGDVARAIRGLDVTDPDMQEAVFALCGLVARPPPTPPAPPPVPEPEPEATQIDGEAEPVDGEPDQRPLRRPPPEAAVPLLAPSPVRARRRDRWADVAPMAREAPPVATPHVPGLFDLPTARPLLADIVATPAAGHRLDVRAVVAAIARRRVLRRLPYLPEPTLRHGVQVLLDRGTGMGPWRRDQALLVAALRRVVGPSKVRELHYRELPITKAGTGPASRWGRYRDPEPGTPVLVATDAGITGGAGVAAGGSPGAWRAMAERLASRGSSLTMLVPFPEHRWPPWLRPPVAAVPWAETTTIGRARAARSRPRRARPPRAERPTRFAPTPGTGPAAEVVADVAALESGVVELAELVSPAVRIDHVLLRAVRLAAAPHLAAEVEAGLWFSPLVRNASADGLMLDPEVAAELRRRLAERAAAGGRERAAVDAARAAFRRVHAGISPALALEERVAWLVVVGEEGAVEEELAPAIAALAAGPDEGLELWAAQAAARLPDTAKTASAGGWVLAQYAPGQGADMPDEMDSVAIESVMATLPRRRLLVRNTGSRVELGDLTGPGMAAVEVPRTSPVVVDVDGRRTSVGAGEVVEVEVSAPEVTLRTSAGVEYRVPAASTGFDVAGACGLVSAVNRGVATGFFVAPDLVVTSAVVGEGACNLGWSGSTYPGRVVASDFGIAVVRLARPATGAPVIPVDPAAPRPADGATWEGGLARGGEVVTITSTITLDEDREPHVVHENRDLVGVPVVIDGTLRGMVAVDTAPAPHAPLEPLERILELLEAVPPRPHYALVMEDHSWRTDGPEAEVSFTVPGGLSYTDIQDSAFGILWALTTDGTDGSGGVRLAYRLEQPYFTEMPELDADQAIFSVEDRDRAFVLPDVDATGLVPGVGGQLVELTAEEVEKLERFVAAAERRQALPDVTADDLAPAADFQQMMALELHTGFGEASSGFERELEAEFGADVWSVMKDATEWIIGREADTLLGRTDAGPSGWREMAAKFTEAGLAEFADVDLPGALELLQGLVSRGIGVAAVNRSEHQTGYTIEAATAEWIDRLVPGRLDFIRWAERDQFFVAGSMADLQATFDLVAPRLVEAVRLHLAAADKARRQALRVFISGSLSDFFDERQAVAERLSEAGHDVHQFETSQTPTAQDFRDTIPDVDVVVAIVGTELGQGTAEELRRAEAAGVRTLIYAPIGTSAPPDVTVAARFETAMQLAEMVVTDLARGREGPLVYLVHSAVDRDAADRLAGDLRARGLRTWGSSEDLPAGEDWSGEIERVISDEADHVVVLQTAALKDRPASPPHRDIELALDRQSRDPTASPFVIPAVLGGWHNLLDELQHLAAASLDDWEDGVERIVSAIMPDRPGEPHALVAVVETAQIVIPERGGISGVELRAALSKPVGTGDLDATIWAGGRTYPPSGLAQDVRPDGKAVVEVLGVIRLAPDDRGDAAIDLDILGQRQRRIELEEVRGDQLGLQQQLLEIAMRALGEEHPDTLLIMESLATEFEPLDPPAAREWYERALRGWEALQGVDDTDATPARARLYGNLARLSFDIGDLDAARELGEARLGAARQLVAQSPEDPEALASTADALFDLGRAREAMGDFVVAAESFDQAVGIADQLVEMRPDAQSLGRRAVAAGARALVASELDGKGAVHWFGAAVAAAQALVEAVPDDADAVRTLHTALTGEANTLTRLGLFDEAIDSLRVALEAGERYRALARDTQLADQAAQQLIIVLRDAGREEEAEELKLRYFPL